ncbi:hypothetical protein FB451DRAFT_1487207, partial [Mycena latifolia]
CPRTWFDSSRWRPRATQALLFLLRPTRRPNSCSADPRRAQPSRAAGSARGVEHRHILHAALPPWSTATTTRGSRASATDARACSRRGSRTRRRATRRPRPAAAGRCILTSACTSFGASSPPVTLSASRTRALRWLRTSARARHTGSPQTHASSGAASRAPRSSLSRHEAPVPRANDALDHRTRRLFSRIVCGSSTSTSPTRDARYSTNCCA